MAARIADCCEDGMLRSLLTGTREYALLVEGDTGYSGKDGAAEWSRLGDVIAGSWERALARIESWLRWEGSSSSRCRRRRQRRRGQRRCSDAECHRDDTMPSPLSTPRPKPAGCWPTRR